MHIRIRHIFLNMFLILIILLSHDVWDIYICHDLFLTICSRLFYPARSFPPIISRYLFPANSIPARFLHLTSNIYSEILLIDKLFENFAATYNTSN
jgi:hypothetical protein